MHLFVPIIGLNSQSHIAHALSESTVGTGKKMAVHTFQLQVMS